MRLVTTGFLLACVLIVLIYWQGASGFSGRRRTSVSSSRRRAAVVSTARRRTILVPSTSRRRATVVSSGRRRSSVVRRAIRVGSRLLSSGRRRRTRYSSNRRLFDQQCERCERAYIAFNPVLNNYKVQYGSISPDAQLLRICRSGTPACNSGRCSVNHLYSNGTVTDYPDRLGGADPYIGRVSSTLETVLICGTLRHVASLQMTLLALAVVAGMWMVQLHRV